MNIEPTAHLPAVGRGRAQRRGPPSAGYAHIGFLHTTRGESNWFQRIRSLPADALPTAGTGHVGVPDQDHVLDRLPPHDPQQSAVLFVAPECDALLNLARQLLTAHVGIVPAIGGNHPTVGLGSVVDDRPHRLEVGGLARPDDRWESSFHGSRLCANHCRKRRCRSVGVATGAVWPRSDPCSTLQPFHSGNRRSVLCACSLFHHLAFRACRWRTALPAKGAWNWRAPSVK